MEQQHFESLYPDTARSLEIQKLSEFIKSGASCQLLSIPGAGRGTVLRLLANNKKVRVKHFGKSHVSTHFVLVNFAEVRGRALFDIMKFMFLSLCDSLRARKMDDEYKKVNSLFKESLAPGDELVLFQGLKEAIDYLALEQKLKIVLLLDRFEEYVPSVTSEFFANLRVLRNRAKYQFSVVFSLNRPLEDILEPTLISDYHEFVAGNYVYVRLQDRITTDFRVSYIEKVTGKKVEKALHEQIIKETGGVGKLVKLAVETVLSRPLMGKDKNLHEYLYSQKSIQGALVDICRSLNPSEQTTLIKGKYDDLSAVNYLECVGVLQGNRIQIPLFEQHISSHAVSVQASGSKIIFDPNTNSITKGDLVLSDQLTSSEFKLLKFLLQNTEKILDREEVISVVWSDVKSTAGITDQAVDQLIFRLRRKIEEDPNHPTHLMTVKGRGFKFVA